MVMLGKVTVVCALVNKNKFKGKWISSIGTEGIFNAGKFDVSELKTELPENNSVF